MLKLLVLDEPTSGLDPLMGKVFQEVVGEAKARGTTVLLSSHILAEVESLADRLTVIRDGVVVEAGTLEQFRGRARTTITATLDQVPSRAALTSLQDVHLDDNRLTATVGADSVGVAMTALVPYGLTSLTVEPPSLESLFLRLYEDEDENSDQDG